MLKKQLWGPGSWGRVKTGGKLGPSRTQAGRPASSSVLADPQAASQEVLVCKDSGGVQFRGEGVEQAVAKLSPPGVLDSALRLQLQAVQKKPNSGAPVSFSSRGKSWLIQSSLGGGEGASLPMEAPALAPSTHPGGLCSSRQEALVAQSVPRQLPPAVSTDSGPCLGGEGQDRSQGIRAEHTRGGAARSLHGRAVGQGKSDLGTMATPNAHGQVPQTVDFSSPSV